MANRKKIEVGECYHIFNRGVDKRLIFGDRSDLKRFLKSIEYFNCLEPIDSLYEILIAEKRLKDAGDPSPKIVFKDKLVDIIAYCLNPNHFHLLLKEIREGGISEFMKRLGGGYTSYFNQKYDRSGSLFEGRFKSVHIIEDFLLQYISVYVNLNWKVHNIGSRNFNLVQSSFDEFIGNVPKGQEICTNKDVILEMFKSRKAYENYANDLIKTITSNRRAKKDIKNDLEVVSTGEIIKISTRFMLE